MKLISRFITISLLAAAIIIPFFLKTENGRPTLAVPTVEDFIPDQILPDSMKTKPESASAPVASSKKSFYKWQDEKGMWHYGDQPPQGSAKVTSVEVNTQANIIQSIKLESDADSVQPLHKGQPQMSSTLADGELTSEDVMNVMSDAKAVRDMMEARNDALKSITGESSQ